MLMQVVRRLSIALPHGRGRLCHILLLVFASAFASAQPEVRVNSISPEGGQRGTTAEVMFRGENIGYATAVLFSGDPGLMAEIVPPPAPQTNLVFSSGGVAPAQEPGRNLRVKIAIAENAPAGEREVRIVTPSGVSNPHSFYVDDYPEILEKEPNNELAAAMAIELPAIVSGAIDRDFDEDFYRFRAAKGQRLIFDVFASRMGSELDSILELLDENGNVIAESEDVNGTDALIDFEAPGDGDFVLRLRDTRNKAGRRYTYRLRAGALPVLDSIFPLGARRGDTVDVAFRGRNLGNVGSAKLAIAPNAPIGVQDVRAEAAVGISTPRRFAIGEYAEMLESEPNNEAAKANAINFPMTINGRIQAEGDADLYRIKIENPMVLVFELHAARLGSPLDGVLTLMNPDGGKLAKTDDNAGMDAKLEYEVREAGEFLVEVRDLLDRGGEDFGYRLTARSRIPDFSVRFKPDVPRVFRGATTVLEISINGAEGFRQPVEIHAIGLPAGVTAEPVLISQDKNSGALAITASHDAALGHQAFRVRGVAPIAGSKVWRDAQPLSGNSGAREAFITVLDNAPFSLELITFTADLFQGESTQAEVVATRRNGFAGDIALFAENLPSGVNVPGVTIKAGENRARLNINAAGNSERGMREIAIKGKPEIDGVAYEIAAGLLPLTVVEAPFALADTVGSISVRAEPEDKQTAAGESQLKLAIDRRGWFTDEVSLSIEGLPEGVIIGADPLGKSETEKIITLRATDKAELDKPKPVRIVATGRANGREFQLKSKEITLTVSAPVEIAAENVADKPAENP